MCITYKFVLCTHIVIIIYHNIPIILTRSILYCSRDSCYMGPSLKRDRFESHRQLYSRRTLLFRRWVDDIYFFLSQKIIIISNTVYRPNCSRYTSYIEVDFGFSSHLELYTNTFLTPPTILYYIIKIFRCAAAAAATIDMIITYNKLFFGRFTRMY